MIEIHDHEAVREVRMARPPVNALSPELIAALTEAITGAPKAGARGLVLSGAPGMFSAGLDVPVLLKRNRAEMQETWRSFYALMGSLAASRIPVFAAITGHSPAGGAVLALYCDGRVMAQGEFRIGLNEVQVGISLPPVIHAALHRLVGARQAERLSVGGLMIPADEALRIGLVDELVPPDRVVARAVELCASLLALPAQAMASTRRMARADLLQLFRGDSDSELDAVLDSWWSDETQATLHALVERLAKRKG
ncbi:MAG TPA: enoyl-CoA hydratase/isomerase family protein [Thermoanaerobaculia bacterium]